MPALDLAAPVATLVAELLHEMGQPLTTLQGCRLLPLLAAEERDALVCDMAGQVDRVTELYRELRSLLAATSPANSEAGKLVSMDEGLRDAAAEWRRQAQRREITLLLDLPARGDASAVVSRPTEHAIGCVVAAALEHAPPGSELHVSAGEASVNGARRRAVTLVVAINQTGLKQLSGELVRAGAGLRVAEALLQAEGGRVVYNLQPFRATIELPGSEGLPRH